MTPLGKTIFAVLSVAVLVSGTLALRHKAPAAASPPQVPAQMVAAQPPERALEPPRTVSADAGAQVEEEPAPEDGSGS